MTAMQLPRCIVLPFPRRLFATLAAFHLCAMGIALAMPHLPWAVRIPLALVILISLVRSWRRMSRQEGLRLTLGRDGTLTVGTEETARLLSHALALRWLVILPLSSASGRRTVWMTSDMLADEDWRCLHAWLRWRAKINGADDRFAA